MYARRVSVQLKPNSNAEFAQQLEKQIVPMLQKQQGFKDEISFISPSGEEAFAVSLWDTKESAELYSRAHYGEVTKMLEKIVVGTPKVDTYDVSSSTFHKIGATATA